MKGEAFSRAQEDLANLYEQHMDSEGAGKDAVIQMIKMLDSGEHKDAESKGVAHGAIGVWKMIREIGDPNQLLEVIDALQETEGDMVSIKHIGIDVAASECAIQARVEKDMDALKTLVKKPYFAELGEMPKLYAFQYLFEKGGPEDMAFLVENKQLFQIDKVFDFYKESPVFVELLVSKMDLATVMESVHVIMGEPGDSVIAAVLDLAIKKGTSSAHEVLVAIEQNPDVVKQMTHASIHFIQTEGTPAEVERLQTVMESVYS